MTNSVPPHVNTIQSYYPQDEIDLVDLWLVLRRRRRVLFAVFGATILATAALIFLPKPVFESRVVVQVGRIGNIGAIETPGVLVERLSQQYRVNDDTTGTRELPRVESVALSKGQQEILTIAARAHDAAEAQSFLSGVVNKLQSEHERILLDTTRRLQERADVLSQRIIQSREQLTALDRGVNALKPDDTKGIAILLQEKTNIIREIPGLEQEEATLRLSLSQLQTFPTRVLREPTLPEKKVKPRPMLYTAVGVVLGVMLGLFAAFFAEFAEKARQRIRATEGR
jgi:LPS O-antigen subunit length determinant protein (WzzB/FepE family)